MEELKWELLTEIQGRVEAEIFKSFLIANGVEEVEMFQEALGQHIYPTALDMLGRVQIFVPKDLIEEARQLLEEYQNTQDTQERE